MLRQTEIAWTISILFWALLAAAQIRLMVTMLGMDQARQIFAGLPLLSIFIVAGILRLFRQRKFAAGTLTIGMAWIAIAALFFVASIYAPRYTNASIANADSIDFGEQIRLVDYRIDQIQVARGDSVAVQINWLAIKDVTENDWLMLQLIAAQEVKQQQEGVPSNGRTTTDWWRAGQTFSSRHALAIPMDIAPGKYQLRMGLHPYGRWDWLMVRGGDFYPLGIIEVR
jgi:TM2 domain-containing membrane protein YozV